MKMHYEKPAAKRITFKYEETVVATGGSSSGIIHWVGTEAYDDTTGLCNGHYARDMYVTYSMIETECSPTPP